MDDLYVASTSLSSKMSMASTCNILGTEVQTTGPRRKTLDISVAIVASSYVIAHPIFFTQQVWLAKKLNQSMYSESQANSGATIALRGDTIRGSSDSGMHLVRRDSLGIRTRCIPESPDPRMETCKGSVLQNVKW
ncbi:hypothetical protein GOBAR_AA21581 [Gossypium barbadense]|uniref:Uncharacterized protein n=1 Tax=Gossypium barbadense TaxID=3634 RepID=A0A2P5X6X0_GOSBA|nr:hypothetical protein GOBAR_AA21581 [Gossypium barbadense]